MKRMLCFLMVLMLFLISCSLDETSGPEPEPEPEDLNRLCINEILASNDAANVDEYGEFDDWFEFYNGSSETIDIAGWFVSDKVDDPEQYQFPTGLAETIIEPGGFLLIWCDDDANDDPLHTNFKLSAGGDIIIVNDETGLEQFSIDFGSQVTDVSIGRLPDGTDNIDVCSTPTPGASNQ